MQTPPVVIRAAPVTATNEQVLAEEEAERKQMQEALLRKEAMDQANAAATEEARQAQALVAANELSRKLAEEQEARRLELAKSREAEKASASDAPKANLEEKDEESKDTTPQKVLTGLEKLKREMEGETGMEGVEGEQERSVRPKKLEV